MEPLSTLVDTKGTRETYRWAKQYVGCLPHQFAVIKVSGECAAGSLDEIAQQVSEIQDIGFTPIMLFGWGKPLTELLAKRHIRQIFSKTGDRVTDLETLHAIEEYIPEAYAKVQHALARVGVPTHHVTFDPVFYAEQSDASLGYVGQVQWVNTRGIVEATSKGIVPLVFPLGFSESGKYNINADTAAKSLVLNLGPKKYIAVTETGGIFDREKHIIPEVSVLGNYDLLKSDGVISGGMLKKMEEAAALVAELNHGFTMQIVHPSDVIKALFTHESVGTKVTLEPNNVSSKGYTSVSH